MIGMIGMIWHEIMLNWLCMWHDGGMTGCMTVRLSCQSQADTQLDRHAPHNEKNETACQAKFQPDCGMTA